MKATQSPLLLTAVEMRSLSHLGDNSSHLKDPQSPDIGASAMMVTINPLQGNGGSASDDVHDQRSSARHSAQLALSMYSAAASRPGALMPGKSKLKRAHAAPEKSRMGRGRGKEEVGHVEQDGGPSSITGRRAQFEPAVTVRRAPGTPNARAVP